MDSVGEGEGGKIWENGIETCKISCMKRVASPGTMHDTIPLGRPSAPAPSIQYRASNLDWQLVSYMIFYMFQCHENIFSNMDLLFLGFGDFVLSLLQNAFLWLISLKFLTYSIDSPL